ncbi:MAG: O-antigen ligase family protein [FCB group bacterium]|jgi:O-antigen ligase|nr:O-antigen ligase family protein [FCB group bacterium]
MSMDRAWEGYEIEERTPSHPWTAYAFLLAVFYLVMPFDVFHSTRYLDQEAFTDVSTSIESIEQGSLGRRVGLMALACAAVVWLAKGTRPLRRNGALGTLIILFLAWAGVSLVWSQAPALTLRRLVILGTLSLGAIGVARRFSLREVLVFTFSATLFLLVAGFLAEVAQGTFKPWDPSHRFGGLVNPVYTGINLSLLLVSSLALRHATERRVFLIVAAIAIPFLLMTRSRVPAASGVVAVLLFGLLTADARRRGFWIASAVVAGSLALVIFGDALMEWLARAALLGRETTSVQTLTGRTPLWSECLKYFAAKPWLGYGYDSFWAPDHITAITDATGFPAVDTHNAYLEWLLGLGIPGCALGVSILLLSAIRLAKLHRACDGAEYAFALAALAIFAINLCSVAIHLHHLSTFIVLVLIAKLGFDAAADPDAGGEYDDE